MAEEAPRLDWNAAKRDALDKIRNLKPYTDEMVLNEYAQLLVALREPEVAAMNIKLKRFVLHQRFPDFAMGFGALFNLACLRETPFTIAQVRDILRIAADKKSGKVSEGKARGMVGDLAETQRRMKQGD